MTDFAKDGTAYDIHGPADAEVVALIHGVGLSRHVWDDLLADFSAKYRVLTYDLYGHGESARLTESASLKVYADQLANLMNELKIEKAHVVGFSIGGMINRRFAMDYRNKLRSLSILNSPHDRGEEAQLQVEERASKVSEQGQAATLDAALARWFTPDYLENGAGVDGVREWRGQVHAESYAQAYWVLANGVRELISPIVPINAPTLVMTCEHDSGSTPAMSHKIASEISDSETIILPELRHLGLMENPRAFTVPILDFLVRTDAG